MPQREYGPVAVPLLMLVGLCVFMTGIGWGLPSRRVDPYLFGVRPVWTGEQILALAGDRGPEKLGADVDRDPSSPGDVLNDTDIERAQIVRRYRLFTDQPDEMITMMALAAMRPSEGDFDPKLYQYGGLWIYPVAALIKLTATLSPQSHYLSHPQQFAWFYVMARLYSAAWGLVGVWAVYRLASRAGAGLLGAVGAALLFIFLPVVVNQAHEAKPHLAGAVLILLAAMAGGKFVETGKARWWIVAGVMCGAAMGMILSAVVVFVMLPAMVMMRPMAWGHRMKIAAGAMIVGLVVYFATNPYVLVHLAGDSSILSSNLSNSAAMYPVGTRLGDGVLNALYLLAHGTTPVLALVGAVGAAILIRSRRQPSPGVSGEASEIRLLHLVGGLILIQFILLAAGKPGEYARFAILPSITLALSAAAWIGRSRLKAFEKAQAIGLLIVLTILPTTVYLRGYSRDAGPDPRRIEYAHALAGVAELSGRTIGVFNEPAPYLLPPIDLFYWRITLLPREFDLDAGDASLDVIVRPVDKLRTDIRQRGAYVLLTEQTIDDLFPSRISWAAKPIEIWVRKDLVNPPTTTPSE